MIAVILLAYVISIFVFLYLFHRYADFFELDNFDDSDDDFDDYNSNEEAYLSYAAFWWIFIFFFIIKKSYIGMLFVSKYFKEISKKSKNIS